MIPLRDETLLIGIDRLEVTCANTAETYMRDLAEGARTDGFTLDELRLR